MKAVLYFSAGDVDKARAAMAQLKTDGKSIHWAPADDFNDPRDIEEVDEVFLVSDAPKVEAAYAARGVKVTKLDEKAPEAAPEPETPAVDEPKAEDDAPEHEEIEAPEPQGRRRGRKRAGSGE